MSDKTCEQRSTDDCNGQECDLNSEIARPNGGNSSIDELLKMLGNRRRRAIFYFLREQEVATVEELAAYLAAEEAEDTPVEGGIDESERIELELVHNLLPRLVDSHFIEYDSRSNTVRYADPPDHLQLFLDFLGQLEQPNKE